MKRKLLFLLCALLTSVGMWADVDYIRSFSNAAWVGGTGGEMNTFPKHGSINYGECYYTSLGTGLAMSQTVNGLPNGTYEVKIYANACHANSVGEFAASSNTLSVNGVNQTVTTIENSGVDGLEDTEYTFSNVSVTDGTITITFTRDAAGANWFTASVKSVVYKGSSDYIDYTTSLTNPSFETGDATGWTSSGTLTLNYNQTNSSFLTNGSKYAEYWQPNGSIDIKQTVKVLKNGQYKIGVDAYARSTSSAKFYTDNDKHVAISGKNRYVLTILAKKDDNVTIGVNAVGTGIGASWFACDNFTLEYYGNAVSYYSPTSFDGDEEITKDTWYDFEVGTAGIYKISSTDAATIRYTQANSDDADTGGETVALSAGGYVAQRLSAGHYYFKSTAASTIKIEALSETNGTDVTNLFIANNSFEDEDMSRWDLGAGSYFGRLTGSALEVIDGEHYAGTNFIKLNRSISQNLTGLPSGNYILQVRAKAAKYNATSVNASVGMGSNSTPVMFDVEDYYTVAYNAADNASATIRFGGQFLDDKYGYFYCDNFTLTYYNTLPNVDISALTSQAMDASERSALTTAYANYTAENGKTVDNYNALQTAIVNAKVSIAKYPTSADADWTGLILNNSFEDGNLSNWTNGDMGAQSNDAFDPWKDGSYYAERWHNSGNKSVKQSLILPEGTYKLTAAAHASNDVTSPQLYAGSCAVAVREKGNYDVYFKSDGTDAVEIGFRATCTNSSWIAVDNFRLTYNPTLPAELTAVEGKMNATVATAQTTAVNAYNATSGQTIDNLITAQTAMLAAYESKLVYNDITTIKNTYDTKAAALDSDGQSAYETATTDASGAYTQYDAATYTTSAQAETAYKRDYITAVKGQGDNSDMTDVIVNPSFEVNGKTGWATHYGTCTQYEPTDIISGNLGDGAGSWYYKCWRDGTDDAYIDQTINLPAGHYRLSALVNGVAGSTVFVQAGDARTSKENVTAWESNCRLYVDFEMANAGNIAISAGGNSGFEYHADDFRLTHYDSDVYENRTAIIEGNGDITSLINGDFQENADGWSGGTRVDWVGSESWRGGSDNVYYERTSNGSLSYTLANMPAGKYKLVAASRGYDGGKIVPEIAGTTGNELSCVGNTASAGRSEINLNGVEMPYSSLGGFTTYGTGHNWRWITATGTLASAGNLVINFNCTGTGWMAIDDVHLYCTELDGVDYTQTLSTIDDNIEVDNTGNASVVTCDLAMSNPNAIISSSAAINGAAGAINNNLVSETVSNLVLYDGYEFAAAGDFTATDATLYRSIGAGNFATICAPFAISGGAEGGSFYEPSSLDAGTLTFAEKATPEAGNSYLFKADGGVSALTGSGTVKAAPVENGEGIKMTGTYTRIDAIDHGNYVLSGGKLYKLDSDVYLNPFRAYFNTGGKEISARDVIIVNIDGGETAINMIEEPKIGTDGQKDGKYLIEGKIVIVRNGVKYSANGQKLN